MKLIEWIFVNQEKFNNEMTMKNFDELQVKNNKINDSQGNWFKKYRQNCV